MDRVVKTGPGGLTRPAAVRGALLRGNQHGSVGDEGRAGQAHAFARTSRIMSRMTGMGSAGTGGREESGEEKQGAPHDG